MTTPAPPTQRPWTRRDWLIVVATVIAIEALMIVAWQGRDLVIPWDSKAQFYNFLRFVGGSLADGEWPLWNPYHYSGFPSIADPQSLLFSPTFLLLAAVDHAPSMKLFDAVIMAHLAIAGLATAALCARRGLSLPASLLAVAIVMLGGPATSRLQHVGLIVSYAYLPLALLLLEQALEQPRWWRSVLFGLVAAVMALGRDQAAFLNGLILIGYAGYRLAASPQPLAFLRTRLPQLVLMGATGAAILAIPVLLSLQFIAMSNRPAIGYDNAILGSLNPYNLITAIVSGYFGTYGEHFDYWGPGMITWPHQDLTDRSVNYLYFGLIPAMFVIVVGLAARHVADQTVRFFAASGLVLLLYAFGGHTPIFHLLFEYFPGVALYRRPADATFPLMLMLAMLAAYSAERWRMNAVRTSPAWLLGGLVAAVALLLALTLSNAPEHRHVVAALQAIGSTLALAVIAGGILFIVHRQWLNRTTALALLVALTTIDLLWRNCAIAINSQPESVYAVLSDKPSIDREVMAQVQGLVRLDHEIGRYPRVEILGPENGWQNAGMTYKIEDTLGYNPLRLLPYERATGASENAHEPKLRPFPRTFKGYRSTLARLLGIEILVFDTPLSRMPAALIRNRVATLREGPPYWVYRLPAAQPRAMLAARIRRTELSATLEGGQIPEFDMNTEALVDPQADLDGVPDTDGTQTEPVQGRIAIAEYRRNKVVLVAETEAPALAVLHDPLYPGWEVRVNGERRPLVRANLLFRGVEIPSGRHEIEFVFRPLSAENLHNALTAVLSGTSAPKPAAD